MPFVSSFRRSGLLPAALASVLVGCSMHPLPEDVTRVSTVDIVKSIRCEALAGIESLLTSLKDDEKLKAVPIIKATMIGLDFEFEIKETNSAGGANKKPEDGFLTLKRGGSFTLDVTGSAALERQNVRRFKAIEPLRDLVKGDHPATCADKTARTNRLYPITGTIGIDEVVRTYVKLEMLTELQKDKRSVASFTKGQVVFSDDIDLTTELRVGAVTTLVLDAVVGSLRVTNASLATGASRLDKHNVIVALTRQKIDIDKKGKPRTAALDKKTQKEKDTRKELLASDSVRDPRSQAALIQMDEDAQTRIVMEMQRRRSLKDDDKESARALGERLLEVLKVP